MFSHKVEPHPRAHFSCQEFGDVESLLFLLNSIAVAVLVVMGLRDDRLRPGVPARSYFRYIAEDQSALDSAKTRSKRAFQPNKPAQGRNS
jgi:hypothetical protein